MNFHLKIWRQRDGHTNGKFFDYYMESISEDSSFLEMLDVLNEQLVHQGEDPIAFDDDCREGICGMCSLTINGIPHGPERATTACQLHMRKFKDGDTIVVEPWRARPFPIVKDLCVNRNSFDKIIQAGGFITARTGSCQDANNIPVAKDVADWAMDGAACIGCGACVAACKNASAMLFVAAKTSQLNSLPQGKAEKNRRTLKMVKVMDELGFGNCSNYGECEAVCPKEISLDFIAQLNRDYAAASFKNFCSDVK
jgi:succinate dehydrogenase / fumarate reductase iron-sulfur subunit